MKCRPSQCGFTLVELTVVVCIIAVLMTVSVEYYQNTVAEARKSGLRLLSSRFTSAVSVLHVKWITDRQPASIWLDDETEVLMNRRGWPIGARAFYIDKSFDACHQIWHALFQNPGSFDAGMGDSEIEGQYRSSRPQKGVCRYEIITAADENHYFDYFSSSGSVKTVVK